MSLINIETNSDSIKDWREFDFKTIKEIWLTKQSLTLPLRVISIEKDTFGCSNLEEFQNLEELNLNNNVLTKIESNSFQYLNKLKKLDLGWNQIEQIDSNGFQGLENLEELDLSENKLTKIKSNTFQQLSKLIKLNLWDNQIDHIDSNEFQGLNNLEELHIKGTVIDISKDKNKIRELFE